MFWRRYRSSLRGRIPTSLLEMIKILSIHSTCLASKKCGIVFVTGAMTLSVFFTSSVFSTTVFVTARDFHVCEEAVLLGSAYTS